MKERQIELLAPAGSYEGFEAALNAGADAVYVGGAAFGARAYAKNFEEEELIRAIDTAHIHGKKLYLTVNTLLKNKELSQQLYDYLLPYYKAGLDAVIVQDLGVFSFIRENFPGLHLHASTQMTVTGAAGMKFLEEQGADRVVAARELSLSELSAMHQASPVEIEAFVHGALCYSYSGQCLMSSLLGGRSGNRGRCAQPCRLPYVTALNQQKFKGDKDLCPLSLKDINTIEILPEILEAGVTSLKIEGRMKQPNYTAGVTAMYRKYLDLLFAKGKENYHVTDADRKYLLDLFNRGGSCTGYYKTLNGPAMMAFSNEKKTGESVAEIRKNKEKLYGNLILFSGSPVILNVSLGNVHASASAGEVQFAQNQPMEEERIRRQMEKLGNTPYVWENLEIQMDEKIFVPMKVLNEVRREALELLTQEILREKRRSAPDEQKAYPKAYNDKVCRRLPVYVSCETAAQAKALCTDSEITGLYLNFDAMKECFFKGMAAGKEMYLSMPHMTRGEVPSEWLSQAQKWLAEGMKGFLVRNMESYAVLRKLGLSEKCVLDHSLYTWNNKAIAFWNKEGVLRNTLPLELNEKELRHRDNRGSEMLVYGYLPLMLSAQCVHKNIYGCNANEEMVRLKDRYDKEFPASCVCRPWKVQTTGKEVPCYNIIYNSIPFGLLKEKAQVEALGIASIRLSFTLESPDEAQKILKDFLDVYKKDRTPSNREFTKGHFKRGAE